MQRGGGRGPKRGLKRKRKGGESPWNGNQVFVGSQKRGAKTGGGRERGERIIRDFQAGGPSKRAWMKRGLELSALGGQWGGWGATKGVQERERSFCSDTMFSIEKKNAGNGAGEEKGAGSLNNSIRKQVSKKRGVRASATKGVWGGLPMAYRKLVGVWVGEGTVFEIWWRIPVGGPS